MKHLGYLNTISLHLLQDRDGDLYLSRDAEDNGEGLYIAFPAARAGGKTLDDVVAEIKALTEDPTARLVAAVRAAVAHYTDESAFEFDGDPLVAALAEFDAAVEARQ
jgi:hypothetical protein